MRKYTEASKKTLKDLKVCYKASLQLLTECLNFTAVEVFSKVNEIKTGMAKT